MERNRLGIQTNSAERFDTWSSTYEKSWTWRWFFSPVHETLEREVGAVSGLSVLDVGCGTGDMLRRFYAGGASRLVGVDASEGMLKAAANLSGGNNTIEFIGAGADSVPLGSEEFDVVISSIAFHHFPYPARALSEMARLLKPDGKLYICDMCSEGLRGRLMLAYGRKVATDDNYYDRASLTSMITDAGFTPTGSRLVRLFPLAMLVSAVKPTR